ncbi:MAG: hypothetical protein WC700_09925 [Gemmatimonadaceae bacterium]|jgi:hypothetical protein
MYVVISWVPLAGAASKDVRDCLNAVLQFSSTGSKPDFETVVQPFDGCTVAAARKPSQGAVVALGDRLLLCTLADTEPDFSFVLAYSETGNYMACSSDLSQPKLDQVTEHP